MRVMFIVKDGRDVFCLPGPFMGICLTSFIGFMGGKREHFRRLLTKRVRRGHVSKDRIVDAVTNEADRMVAEEPGDKTCSPALGQIGVPEIRVRQNQFVQFILDRVLRHSTVQVDTPFHWARWGGAV